MRSNCSSRERRRTASGIPRAPVNRATAPSRASRRAVIPGKKPRANRGQPSGKPRQEIRFSFGLPFVPSFPIGKNAEIVGTGIPSRRTPNRASTGANFMKSRAARSNTTIPIIIVACFAKKGFNETVLAAPCRRLTCFPPLVEHRSQINCQLYFYNHQLLGSLPPRLFWPAESQPHRRRRNATIRPALALIPKCA